MTSCIMKKSTVVGLRGKPVERPFGSLISKTANLPNSDVDLAGRSYRPQKVRVYVGRPPYFLDNYVAEP